MTRSKEIVAYSASFTGPVAGNAFLAMIVVLEAEWNASTEAVLLAIPAFMLPFAIIQLFSGAVSNAYDRRLTLSVGLLVYIVGSVAAAASPSLEVFLGTRVVQGVGYAFVSPVLVPIVSDIAGKDRQGLAMGYLGSTSTAGVTLGPLLGGLFAEVNWRLAFVAIALMASAVLAAVLIVFRGESGQGAQHGRPGSLGQLRLTLKNRDVMLLSLGGFVGFASFIGVVSYLSPYLGSQGFSTGEIGFALMFSGLSGVFLSPVAGKLVDRKGARCCAVLGFAIAAFAAFAMQFADDYAAYVALLAVLGLGSSFIWSAMLTMLMRAYPTMKDSLSAVFNSARFSGYAASPVLLAPVFSSAGFEGVVTVCAVANVACVLVILTTRRSLDRG
ncbi:MAG: MFS transporter [Methanobacteriota archaeon]|nr:MAG: MFS transporter [Euryarchaeota archaeon]